MAHSGAQEVGADTAAGGEPRRVELAVGIVTRNHGETVGPVVQSIGEAVAAGFPGGRALVIQADGGSQDGTLERAREAAGAAAPLCQVRFDSEVLTLPGASGFLDPAGLRAVLVEAQRVGAAACVVLDPQVRTLPPAWVDRLAGPVLQENVDFSAPYYLRHHFEGTLTSGIAYPLQRALFGKQVRFPLAVDFAGSARFVAALLAGKSWPAELGRLGAESWLVARALSGGFAVGQTFLGVKDTAGGEGAGAEVSDVLARVLGGLYLEMERHASVWQKVRRSGPVPFFGAPQAGSAEGRTVDRTRALETFRLGEGNLQEIWRMVLSPHALLELARLARRPEAEFRFPDGLWARIVYDFGLAHRLRVMNRDHLLAAFLPLYQGWLAGFAGEVGEADPVRAEQRIEELCLRFESEKPYLISRWRWPDRFNP